MIFRSFARRLAGSGRVASLGPSFGGAGMRTVATYGMWGAFVGGWAYLFLIVWLKPTLGELKYELVKRYPWLDQKDPDEMD